MSERQWRTSQEHHDAKSLARAERLARKVSTAREGVPYVLIFDHIADGTRDDPRHSVYRADSFEDGRDLGEILSCWENGKRTD